MRSYKLSDLPRANVIIKRTTLAIFKSLGEVEGETPTERLGKAFNIALRRLVTNGALVEKFGELELTKVGIKQAARFVADYDNSTKLAELENIGHELKAW